MSHLTEHVQTVRVIRHSELPVVEKLLDHWWRLWSASEAELRAKEQEEQSLYKYRSKTHVIQESEDDISESQLREMFPVFEDWEDEDGVMAMEEDGRVDEVEEEDGSGGKGKMAEEDINAVTLTSDELQSVANLHQMLYNEDTIPAVVKSSQDMSYQLGSTLTKMMECIPGKY